MANQKVLDKKQIIVSEITDKIKESSSVVFFDYRGLSVAEVSELRNRLNKIGSDIKVYKNTLTKRALENLNLDIDDNLIGPNAMAFSKDVVEPLKIITVYAKEHKALEIKVGIIDGTVSERSILETLATVPPRDTLLTMLAGGMIGIVKDLSICLHLLGKQKSE